MGSINRNLQSFISAFFQWKKAYVGTPKAPRFHEFMETAALRRAERTFYSVGATEEEAYCALDEQLTNLEELARFIVTRVAATVLEDEAVLRNGNFIDKIDLETLRFDPNKMREHAGRGDLGSAGYLWFSSPIRQKQTNGVSFRSG